MQKRALRLFSQYLGSIDVGTGSTRFILFTTEGQSVSSHQIEMTQYFPGRDMHEQDPYEYVHLTRQCIESVVEKSGVSKSQVAGIGITNQRETTLAWHRDSGEPLSKAIVWDDSRTASICESLSPYSQTFKSKTGLPVFSYFSLSKMIWLKQNVPDVQKALDQGKCMFGTVESWLLYNLTKEKVHVTDISNASRTLLMNLEGHWDSELMEIGGIPKESLPEIKSCCEVYGYMDGGALDGVPICGSLGDQQSALLGHHCLEPGSTKNTFGTGSFLLMNTGDKLVTSSHGLLTTVYGQFSKEGKIQYALEGAVEAAGSMMTWIINQLKLVNSVGEIEELASQVEDSGGVYCVPALSGLFAPHWRTDARGLIIGLTHHTARPHLIRAVLEGVCFRTGEVMNALYQDSRLRVPVLSVDGGMTANNLLIQLQADIAGVEIEVPQEKDLTALGASYAAGLGSGVLSLESIQKLPRNIERRFYPNISELERKAKWEKYQEAMLRSLKWIN